MSKGDRYIREVGFYSDSEEKIMTDRAKLAEKIYINCVQSGNPREAAEYAIDRANIFFNVLEGKTDEDERNI